VRCRTAPAFRRLSYLRITNTRVLLAQHFALRPDVLVEIPRAAVISVSRARGSWIRLEVNAERGGAVVMRPWQGGLMVEQVLRVSADELCRLLEEWRAG
jgi:hypothetical protein